MFLVLNPRNWPGIVGQLRRGQPGALPMLMMAACGTMAFSYALRRWLAFSMILLASTCVFLLLTSVASLFVMRDGLMRLFRYRRLAWWRHRWWFEIARIALLTGIIFGWVSIACGLIELAFGVAWFDAVVLLLQLSLDCGCLFLIAGTWGILLAKLNRRRLAGRAYLCIETFYALGMSCLGSSSSVYSVCN